ncbi:MAG: hypothetical protein HQK83_08090 [Fibrobacteria bacterium]|nr:hypothetical protein [Fibrobacteria bacterium]
MKREEILMEGNNEINILKWIYLFYKNKLLLLFFLVMSGLYGVITGFLEIKQYESVLTLVQNQADKQGSALSRLGGLASSFGFGGGGLVNETEKYEDFIQSRNFAEKLSEETFLLKGDSIPLPLYKILDPELQKDDSNFAIKKTNNVVGHMKENFTIEIRKNGIIKMTTLTPYPDLSAKLLNKTAELFDAFYRDYQGKKSLEMRKFVEKRALDLEKKLRLSEEQLKVFKEKNQAVVQSPRLMLEMERIKRQISLDMKLFMTVKTELEMAKINEQKSIPILKVLDPAIPCSSPKTPNKRLILVSSIAVGMAIAFLLVFLKEYYRKLRPILSKVFIE